jgi:hypothetical protein
MVPEFTKLGEKISGDGKLSSRVVVAKVGWRLHQHQMHSCADAVPNPRAACWPCAT